MATRCISSTGAISPLNAKLVPDAALAHHGMERFPDVVLRVKGRKEKALINQGFNMEAEVGIEPAYTALQAAA